MKSTRQYSTAVAQATNRLAQWSGGLLITHGESGIILEP